MKCWKFSGYHPLALDWKRVAKLCQICCLHAPFARRFADPIPRKGSIWCLTPLVDGRCMFIPRKGSRVETHLGYRRICHHARRLNPGYAIVACEGPCRGGNFLTSRMVKGFNRLEWRG